MGMKMLIDLPDGVLDFQQARKKHSPLLGYTAFILLLSSQLETNIFL